MVAPVDQRKLFPPDPPETVKLIDPSVLPKQVTSEAVMLVLKAAIGSATTTEFVAWHRLY